MKTLLCKHWLAVLLPLIISLLSSCNSFDNHLLYTYKNISITRIDKGSKTYFYWGDIDVTQQREPNMEINWGARDGGFKCYLIFNDDKTVELVREFGWFETPVPNRNFFLSTRFNETPEKSGNVAYIHWIDSLKGKLGNVRLVESLPLEDEIKKNMEDSSLVRLVQKGNK